MRPVSEDHSEGGESTTSLADIDRVDRGGVGSEAEESRVSEAVVARAMRPNRLLLLSRMRMTASTIATIKSF